VAIDLQKVEGLSANAVEFAVLVKNDGVIETLAELCVHDCRHEVFRISMLDGFHGSKAGHTMACDQIHVKTIKARVLSRRVGVDCRKPPRYVPYKGTYVPYGGTFGTSDQGQTLDV
jgi:hypothetical protein